MQLRRHYRELIAQPGLLVMPGVYDALSARIAEQTGFVALVAGGNAAIGSMLGGPDIGQSNMRNYADHYARICAAVDVPVSVDADTGFGDVHNVRQTVRSFEAAGVAGLMISDQVFPNRCGYLPGKQVVAVEQMLARIKTAVDARRDADMVIIARTDAAGVNGLDDAIDRACLYVEAGADIGRPQGVDGAIAISRVVRDVPCPFFAILSQAANGPGLDLGDLERLGAAAVTLPTLALFAAAQAVAKVMAQLHRDNSVGGIQGHLLPLADYYQLVGLAQEQAREKSFHEAARYLIEASAAAAGQGRGSPVGVDHHGVRGESPGIAATSASNAAGR